MLVVLLFDLTNKNNKKLEDNNNYSSQWTVSCHNLLHRYCQTSYITKKFNTVPTNVHKPHCNQKPIHHTSTYVLEITKAPIIDNRL